MSLRRDLLKSRLHALALAASVALFSLAGCGGDKPDALVASAKEYLAKNDSRSAVVQLKSALQQQPALAEARFLLGRALLDTGEVNAAEVELRKAIELKYDESAALPLLARAMVLQGKGAQVIAEDASKRLADPAAVAELKTVLATAYLQQNNPAQAQAAVDAALQAVPNYVPALLMQSRLKAARHDFDAALALVDQALAKDPSSYEALQMKGDLLFFAKSDAEGAMAAQRQALALRKNYAPAHRSVMEMLLLNRDLAGAATELAAMKKVLPNQLQTMYFEAELAYLNRDYKTARELAQQMLRGAPDNLRILVLAGGVELQMGSLVQAETYAAKALQIAPDLPVARRLLARVYLRTGQAQKAIATLESLVDTPEATAEALALAAEAALQSGDANTADEYFRRAAKIDPNDMAIRTSLALTQFSKGKPELGFEQLHDISATDKGVTADMALVNQRLRLKQYGPALEAIDSLQRKEPNKPFPWQLRGQVQIETKDIAGARQSFEKALAIDAHYLPAAVALSSLDLQDKHPEAAQARLDKLREAEPKNARVVMAIAELRSRTGASTDDVNALLAEAVKLDPSMVTPRLMLIDSALRRGDSKRALAFAQEGDAAIPDSPQMLDALGRAQMAVGNINQAIILYKKLVIQLPRSPQPLLRLSDAYGSLNNTDAAREMLQRALQIAPGLVIAQRQLVVLEMTAGRMDQAMKISRSIIALRPDLGTGYLLAGDVDMARKNWSGAAETFRTGFNKAASTELAIKLYNALTAGGKTADAQALADDWLKTRPDDAAFIGNLGDIAMAHADLPGAEKRYLSVVQIQPDNAIALNNLAWIASTLKKPGALDYAEKANKLAPDQPAIIDTLATVLADSGDVKRALDLQKKAVAMAPTQPAFQLNLAKLYLKSGDKMQARSELDQLAKLGDKFSGQAEVGRLLKEY